MTNNDTASARDGKAAGHTAKTATNRGSEAPEHTATPATNRGIEAAASDGRAVALVEVSPRDGIQADPTMVSTEDKVRLVQRAVAAGIRRVETVSFVNPKRVPQMADGPEVMARLNAPGTLADRRAVSLAGLVLNARGLESALETGVDEINVVVVSTDTFAMKNQGKSTMELVDVWHEVGSAAKAAGLFTTVTVASVFGCPYEGEVSDDRFAQVVEAIMAVPPDEIALADSIGVAVPTDIRRRIAALTELAPGVQQRCHLHNTRNTGLANAAAAVEAGVRVLDASMGGVGGCNFAPNATGNIPTEDLAYMLERMGYPTGLDLLAAIEIVPWIEGVLQHSAPGYLARAGVFPPAVLAS